MKNRNDHILYYVARFPNHLVSKMSGDVEDHFERFRRQVRREVNIRGPITPSEKRLAEYFEQVRAGLLRLSIMPM